MRGVAFALVLSLIPATVSAQSHREVIDMQLDATISAVAEKGFRIDANAFPNDRIFGLLPPDGVVWLQLDLSAGHDYVIAGACDYDCADMDLALQHDTTVLAEDVELDDKPVLVVKATKSGAHLVRVSMPGCEASGCYFGIRVLKN